MINLRLITVTILLIVGFGNAFSQVITVFDRTSLEPLSNVHILTMDSSVTAITDKNGTADFTPFKDKGNVIISHQTYTVRILSYTEAQKLHFQIPLDMSTFDLTEMVVSANRREQPLNEISNRVEVINSNQIEFENPQTAADVLASSGEVYVQKSQQGGGSPMIRGFSANRILLVVDGVRMNNAIFRGGNLQNVISVDPSYLNSTEVIYGPSSVIYGSDALGGVVLNETKMPSLSYQKDSTLVKGSFMTRYSSANAEKSAHFDLSLGGKRFGSYTSLSFSKFGDLTMGSRGGHDSYTRPYYQARVNGVDTVLANPDPNVQIPSGYDATFFNQKFIYQPNRFFNLTYGFYYSTTTDIPRYDRMIQFNDEGEPKYADWHYGPQNWLMNMVNMKGDISEKLWYHKLSDHYNLTFGQQIFEESRYSRKFQDTQEKQQEERVNAYSVNLDFDKTLNQQLKLMYGYEGVFNLVGSNAQYQDINTGDETSYVTRYPDGSTTSSHGVYLGSEYKKSERTIISAGLRYSHNNLNADVRENTNDYTESNISNINDAVTFSLGYLHDLNQELKLTSNISSGFRAPNIDDVTKIFESYPGIVVTPNPDLKPEYSYNFDLGLHYKLSKNSRLTLTGYATWLNNVIVRDDFTYNGQDSIFYDGEMAKVEALQNNGNGWVAGGNIQLKSKITRSLSFKGSFSLNKGADGQGNGLRHVSPSFGRLGVNYDYQRIKAEVYYVVNTEIDYDHLAPEEREKTDIYAMDENGNPYSPMWQTLNFKGSYYFSKNFEANLGVENILDLRYRTYSSGIAAPGRNLIISLRAHL